MHKYGEKKCPCIGIDNIEGTTDTTLGVYPADLGAHCEAWEHDRIADCKVANPPSWCEDSWCYVDPCNCDLEVLPKTSSAQPDAKYQGKTLYYSYATCGSVDKWTESNDAAKGACINQKDKATCNGNEKCLWSDSQKKCGGKELMGVCKKPIVDYEWGEVDCRCIGIDGQKGVTNVRISENPEKHMDYPADVGATCDAWDNNRHPDCQGPNKADWCIMRWCFVDPCKCNLGTEAPPKQSSYLPEATAAQGRPLFYSYWTCGSEDVWTSEEKQAKALSKQAEVCSSAWAASPIVGLLVAAFMSL